jgi:hypothetical protein
VLQKRYDLFNKGEISDYDFLYADGGLCMLNVATKKHSGYMYLDGKVYTIMT